MIISGYFGTKFKFKTLVSFIVQAVFYSSATYILYHIILSPENFSASNLIKSFFPLTYPVWWFLNAFVGVYLLSPIINKGLDSLKAYQSGALILVLIYLFFSYPLTGYNMYTGAGSGFVAMLIVYIIARYCGKYIPNIKRSTVLCISIYIIAVILVLICLKSGRGLLAWRLVSHNSLLVLLAPLFFFYTFKKIKLNSSIINKIAPLTFGIYLVHETPETGDFLRKITGQLNNSIENPLLLGLALIGLAICIFIICAIIEKTRQVIFNPVVDVIDEKTSGLRLKLKTLINNLTTH